mmetsp:Transcript_37436/g.87308  ORF Transcript_37436/g.87308 Transcript_37436/m.87308 type:complete len:257 (-) Transcript_37436:233-1003(-)
MDTIKPLFFNTLDDEVRQADDYYVWQTMKNETGFEDDYVFSVPLNNRTADQPAKYWVSTYQMVYFSAALCFLIVGAITYCKERKFFDEDEEPRETYWSNCCPVRVINRFSFLKPYEWASIFMCMGGVFGILGAMFVHISAVSNALSCVSVHFYLLVSTVGLGEISLQAKRFSKTELYITTNLLWLAEMLFFMGTTIEVTLAYIYLNPKFLFNLDLAKWGIFSATLWVINSTIYMCTTIYIYYVHSRSEKQDGTSQS